MKKSLITTLVAAPLLSLSSFAFAAEPASSGPMMLSATQLDSVTAGAIYDAGIFQINISPVTVVQISVLNGVGNNIAGIISGNLGAIGQH